MTTTLSGFTYATPDTLPSGSAEAAITTAAPTSVAVGGYAFSQTQATALIAGFNEVTRVLTLLKLWKGSI